MIRNAAKVILLDGGRVLLNRCAHDDGRIYYDLPGGGQHEYESIEQAALREVREETGYQVELTRFAALSEEIYTDAELRRQYPDYTHRILHIFIARLTDAPRAQPSERDIGMIASEWVPVDAVAGLPELCPDNLRTRFSEVARGDAPVWLGTLYVDAHGA